MGYPVRNVAMTVLLAVVAFMIIIAIDTALRSPQGAAILETIAEKQSPARMEIYPGWFLNRLQGWSLRQEAHGYVRAKDLTPGSQRALYCGVQSLFEVPIEAAGERILVQYQDLLETHAEASSLRALFRGMQFEREEFFRQSPSQRLWGEIVYKEQGEIWPHLFTQVASGSFIHCHCPGFRMVEAEATCRHLIFSALQSL